MFRCARGHWTEPGEKMTRVADAVREKDYSDGGTGFEAISEIALCPEHSREREEEIESSIAEAEA